jgi:hypothetical protein
MLEISCESYARLSFDGDHMLAFTDNTKCLIMPSVDDATPSDLATLVEQRSVS